MTVTEATGYVVMAAYRPDPTLFGRQVRSIQAQTLTDFVCLISVDGDPEPVAELLREVTDGDERFVVLGYEDRLGFYGNFERGLYAVPQGAPWIALADQDDKWDPNKLETLVPLLETHAVVSCQARVVKYPEDVVVSPSTNRRDVPIAAFTLDNQYTGSQMVFRGDLLSTVLPFPRLETPAQVHDHWIALAGGILGGSHIIEQTLQDYVQHGGNVIGEAQQGFSPSASLRNAQKIARKYEGDASLRSMARVTYRVGVQWREVMVQSLADRVDDAGITQLTRLYGFRRNFWRTMRYVWSAARRGQVSVRSAAEYSAGWIAGVIFRFRGR